MTSGLRGVHITMLLDNPYAPDWRVEREAAALTEAGAAVSIVCWDREGSHPENERQTGIQVERIRTPSARHLGLRQITRLARFYARAFAHLRRRRIDIVHVHDLPMLPLGIAIARRARARLVYDAHEIYHIMEARKYPKAMQQLIALVERLLIRSADAMITVSSQRVDAYWLRVTGRVPITVVGNWYDRVDVGDERRAQARAGFGVPDRSLCIVYAGGLTEERRLDLLISAARGRPEAWFLVAGRGDPVIEKSLSEASAALPNLRYLGWIQHPQRLYEAGSALYYVLDPAHPYSRYAASNTLYLAIAYGIPMITADVGEPGMVMRQVAPDLVLAPVTSSKLLAAIDALAASDSTAWKRRIEPLRDRFTWKQASDKLVAVYENLVRDGRRRGPSDPRQPEVMTTA